MSIFYKPSGQVEINNGTFIVAKGDVHHHGQIDHVPNPNELGSTPAVQLTHVLKKIRVLQEAGVRPEHAVFARNGSRVIAIDPKNSPAIVIWDLASDNQYSSKTYRLVDGVTMPVRISSGGSRVVFGHGERTVLIWDVESCSISHIAQSSIGRIVDVAISHDGSKLVTSSFDNIQSWHLRSDTKDGSQPVHLTNGIQVDGHGGSISPLKFSRNGRSLVSVGAYDKSAVIRDSSPENALLWNSTLKHEHLDEFVVTAVDLSSNGTAALGFQDGKILLMDAETEEWSSPEDDFVGHDTCITGLISADGKWLFTSSVDRSVKMWDTKTGKPASKAVRTQTSVDSLERSADEKSLLGVERNGQLVMWEVHAIS
ncbi:hypothetical protein H0H92_014176 [Tricholoma furcatifolium]|nr:hypothetical protein H0H92_014176 [Tricholoma furcatifolium]